MILDAERWERVQALFHAALELPEPDRQAFLEAECGTDARLLAEVGALLEEDARSDSVLDSGLAALAGDVFDGPVPLVRQIGPHRILGVLGQGGMGVVYLAEHAELGRRVAIKVLRDAWLSPSRRERFEREAHTLARLEHPSIARLYDAGVLADGTPFLVMEYVEGRPLTDHCAVDGATLPERLRLFREICGAVQHAHRLAIIHRDLKPANILVSRDGPGGHPSVKLLDFGIAKQLEQFDSPVRQTRTGLRLMTPAYAAPEQLRGEAIGVGTDVYALGVILYELVTDSLPFELDGLSPGRMETLILETQPERPSARVRKEQASGAPAPVRPKSPSRAAWADLDVLCLTAMHPDTERRYPTVEALIRDLDHFERGEPLEARPDTLAYRLDKFVRRNRRAVAAAALAVAALVSTTAFYTTRLAEERNRALLEAEKAQQVSEYVISLFEAGDPFAPAAGALDIRTLLDRGVERAERLAAQPLLQAQMLDVLGRVHMRVGDYERAEPLLRQAMSARDGDADPLDVAGTMANLGRVFAETSRADSAEAYLRQALALQRSHLPARHPDLVAVLNDLGSVLTTAGEFQEAESLYQEALQIQRSSPGGPHEGLGQTLSNLGVNFFNQGRHGDAEPFYREALEVDRAVFGSEHPTVATRMANLGMVLEYRGDLAGSDATLTEAIAMLRRTLGDEHYLTAYYGMSHGALLRKMKEYDRSERVLREALGIHEARFGPDHLNTVVSANQLALTLRDRGRYGEAEPLFRRSAEAFRAQLGDHHYYSGSALAQLADVLHRIGRPDEAEALYREGLGILEAVFPPDHASVVLHKSRFGHLLTTKSRFDEAEALLLEAHEQFLRAGGPDHDFTREAAAYLAALYDAWDRPEEASAFAVPAPENGGRSSP